MKRTISTSFLLILACSAAFGLDFRATSWMMTRDQVIASEQGDAVAEHVVQDQRDIEYRRTLYGRSAVISYHLESDRLLSASYTIRKDTDTSAFDALRRDISARCGAPAFEKETIVGWRLPQTEIALTHIADGTTCVVYWEKSYFALMSSKR